MEKRFLGIFTAVSIFFSILPIQVYATQTRASNFSKNYTLTGNYANDIVSVAEAQLGKTRSQLGYTEAWCANFATDCARLTGMPDNIVPYNYGSRGGCRYLYSYMVNNCGAQPVLDRQAGDFIFYYCALCSTYPHVGIVADSIYSYEGNYSDKVSRVPVSRKASCYHCKNATQRRYLRPHYGTPPVQGNNPKYCLDSLTGDVGSITLRGWAFDEDDTSQSIPVHVYIGGPAGSANAEGYPITANTFRDDVNTVYGCGNYHGFDASISVSKTGEQPIYIYACNIGSGSTQLIAQKTVTITSPDTERPIISNARIENLTNEGYDVICNVTDNLNINRVQFVTWSEANGQDDIAPGWESNPIVSGAKNNNGEYVFHVNIAEHYGNRGLYSTHIYAYDDYGNYSGYPLTVLIPGYDYCFDEISLSDDSLYIKGWATAVNGFDSIKAILTDNDGASLSYDITNRYYRSDIETHRPGWDSSLAGFSETFDISKLKTGNITMRIQGLTDNSTYTLYNKTIAYNDIEAPVITNARIVNVTNEGYDIICNVADNVNVNRVQFATWSDANGQDDIAPDWENNPAVSGMKNNNGEYAFHVNIAEHDGNRGLYYTHIYAFDDSGNAAFVPLTPIVPGYDATFDSATLEQRNLTISGWATSINGIENLKMTVTDRKGKTAEYDITNRFNREDVTSIRPDWNTEKAGYKQTFDLSNLASGSAVIEITGELYQKDISKKAYLLGKKVIELKDNLSVSVSVSNDEIITGEEISISVNVVGAESTLLNIYNEKGLYETISITPNTTYMKSFDAPGEYYVNAKAVGYEDSLTSDNVYFTIVEEPELEPDAEENVDIIVSEFSYQMEEENISVQFLAINVPETAIIYIASYDVNGKLLEVQTPKLINNSAKVSFEMKDVCKFKAFIWDVDLKPLAPVQDLKI